ncbi:hypothetical protein [Novipirellula aureliae]|uniref:hypothetical protein n=1 Tax=Novipirellula aureliae TaxID=2527966 RepID=UPI0011B3E818|nr:hypothetical protein [Novipirellula aureliae]
MFYYISVGNHTEQVDGITEILRPEPGALAGDQEKLFPYWGCPKMAIAMRLPCQPQLRGVKTTWLDERRCGCRVYVA